MSKNIFEELPSRKGGEIKPGADAAAGIEKRARQLVYDSRYEVKKMLAGKKADPATQERMVLQRIAKSTAIPAVKASARQMVSKKAAVAEDFIPMMEDAAATNIANAMFKVFVEGVDKVIPDYLEELNVLGDKKYKIRVTDPKTGNSYVRYGTRDKITQLRAKGLKVEMTEYGEPREGERKRGEETAHATGGGGKAKRDYDGDGKIESPAKEHAGAVHNAIQRKRGLPADGQDTSNVKEDFLADGTESTEGQNKAKITGKVVDNYASGVVKVSPEDGSQTTVTGPKAVYAHTEYEGETISEGGYSKFLEMLQEKKMTKAAKKKEKKLKAKYDPSGMKASMKKQYGEKKGEEVYFATIRKQAVKEESDCGCDGVEKKDSRGDYAKINLIKNKLRAMGIKNPIVMVANENVESGPILPGEKGRRVYPKGQEPKPTGAKLPLQNAGFEPIGNIISEREFDEPGESGPDVERHNASLRRNQSPETYEQRVKRKAAEQRARGAHRRPRPGTYG